MITAGKYRGELGAIRHFTAENFPICEDGKETVVVTLYSLDDVRNTLGIQIFHTDLIITSMFLDGLRPATLAELLALGEQHPYLQLQYNIVAFGSLWVNTYRYVPTLTSTSGKTERILSITHFSQSWFDQYRFAAVQIHN